MKSIFLLFLIVFFNNKNIVSGHLDLNLPDHKHVFDLNLFKSVLDPELCDEQIKYIQQNDPFLSLEFMDAGIRTPRGILNGNLLDLGNYHQCLDIRREIPNSVIEGKYCMINLPLNQNWASLMDSPAWPDNFADIPWDDLAKLNPRTLKLQENVAMWRKHFDRGTSAFAGFNGGSNSTRIAGSPLASLTFRLAVCIPKSCSTHTALQSYLNVTELSLLQFEESFCRLPNDKQWVTGEYVALAIFSLFGVLVLLSTSYDIWHNVILEKDLENPVSINKLCLAFSAYTNTRRLVTYVPVPGTIECLDGIRSLAMIWVILGHTFVNQLDSGIIANAMDALDWITSLKSIWITAAPITVDTFFMLSGLLLVYTTAGKFTSMKLLKNLHLVYLGRLLRMFPLLAATILLQISVFSRAADGPYWTRVNEYTHNCRVFWWSTLLYIQNYLNPSNPCIPHSWYLAIDMQLHILSPIVLFWVLSGRRRMAWTALVCAMLAIMAGSTTYNFINDFPPAAIMPARLEESIRYMVDYYMFTLTRASPFFVGLIFGYILHLNRGKKVAMPWILALLLWACSLTIAALIVYSVHPIMQLDWDNQLADNMINSFMRPAWAMSVGWLVFACEHGYGGPVNWLLSLRFWKVLSRLSYAMYLVHYTPIFMVNATEITPIVFSVQKTVFKFLSDFTLSVIIAFLVTIVFDSPCSIFIKHFLGGGPKRPQPKETANETAE